MFLVQSHYITVELLVRSSVPPCQCRNIKRHRSVYIWSVHVSRVHVVHILTSNNKTPLKLWSCCMSHKNNMLKQRIFHKTELHSLRKNCTKGLVAWKLWPVLQRQAFPPNSILQWDTRLKDENTNAQRSICQEGSLVCAWTRRAWAPCVCQRQQQRDTRWPTSGLGHI